MKNLPVQNRVKNGLLELARELEMQVLKSETIGTDGEQVADYYIECTAKEFAELNSMAKEYGYV